VQWLASYKRSDSHQLAAGAQGNPNEIAFHLWLGMSFLVLLAARCEGIKKLLLGEGLVRSDRRGISLLGLAAQLHKY